MSATKNRKSAPLQCENESRYCVELQEITRTRRTEKVYLYPGWKTIRCVSDGPTRAVAHLWCLRCTPRLTRNIWREAELHSSSHGSNSNGPPCHFTWPTRDLIRICTPMQRPRPCNHTCVFFSSFYPPHLQNVGRRHCRLFPLEGAPLWHSFYLKANVGDTWFLVTDVDVKRQNDDVGQKGGPPVDDEHDHAAQHRSSQRHPHVVVLKARPPPCPTHVVMSVTNGMRNPRINNNPALS